MTVLKVITGVVVLLALVFVSLPWFLADIGFWCWGEDRHLIERSPLAWWDKRRGIAA